MSILTTFDLSVSFLAFALSLLPVPHSMHRLRSSSDGLARKALDMKGKDLVAAVGLEPFVHSDYK